MTDLTPLVNTQLTSLDIQGTPVTDLAPLCKMPGLERLNIAGSAVTDVRPLAQLRLSRLILTPSKIKEGLEVIRAMPSLNQIDLQFEEGVPTRTPEQFWADYDAGKFKQP